MQLQENLAPQIATLDASVAKLQASIESQTYPNPVLNEASNNGYNLPSRYITSLQLKEVAQKVRTDASVVSAARSTIWGGSERASRPNSMFGEQRTSVLHTNVENWLSRPESSTVSWGDMPGEKKAEDEGSIATSESFLPSIFSHDNSGATEETLTNGEETELHLDDELDYELSQRLLIKACKYYDLGLYDDAESVFREAFKQISSVHHSRLAQFNITEASLKLARACLHQQKMNECEVILLDILRDHSADIGKTSLILDTCFTLSELHLRRGNFPMAKDYCKRTVRGRRKLYGTDNKGCFEAIQMLVYICTRSGERHEADAWSEMLPSEQRGYFPISSAIINDGSYVIHPPSHSPGLPTYPNSPPITKDARIELPGSQMLDHVTSAGLRRTPTDSISLKKVEIGPESNGLANSAGNPNAPTSIRLNANLLPNPSPEPIYDMTSKGSDSHSG